MRNVMFALGASALLAGPAAAQPKGNAYGQDPRVCLVTFESAAAATSGADTGVIKAQYLPLSVALKLEAKSDSTSNIFTYGSGGFTGAGVDTHVAAPSDPALGITANMTTQQVCSILAAFGETNQ
jgi:hypothetical protein